MTDPIKDIEALLKKRLEKCAIHLVNTIKLSLNVSQPYTITKSASGKHYHGEDPSSPGEPPHKLTGELQRSIANETAAVGLGQKVGTNLEKGVFLELGTSKMAPRPFLRPALISEKSKLEQILGGK